MAFLLIFVSISIINYRFHNHLRDHRDCCNMACSLIYWPYNQDISLLKIVSSITYSGDVYHFLILSYVPVTLDIEMFFSEFSTRSTDGNNIIENIHHQLVTNKNVWFVILLKHFLWFFIHILFVFTKVFVFKAYYHLVKSTMVKSTFNFRLTQDKVEMVGIFSLTTGPQWQFKTSYC